MAEPRPHRVPCASVQPQGLLGAGASWSPLGMEGVRYAGTGRGCPREGVGQSSPPPGHEGGQAHVGKAHDPLRLGLECTPNTWAPSQPLSSGHHLLSWSQILDWELLLVLSSMLGNWWLDGRTSFAIVRSDGWMLFSAQGHRHQGPKPGRCEGSTQRQSLVVVVRAV